MTISAHLGALPPLNGVLGYVHDEYSFDFEATSDAELSRRKGELDGTSVQIGTLLLELGVETGLLLYAWGYHPHTQWQPAAVMPPPFTSQTLTVTADPPFAPGISRGIAVVGEWTTWYDRNTGWLHIAADDSAFDTLVCIADGVLVGLKHDQIRSVWLNPTTGSGKLA